MTDSRSKTLQMALILFFSFAIARFFFWQILKSDEYKQKILSQTYKLEKILPQRGKIFSSDGQILATNQTYYQLSLYKPNFQNDFNEIINQIDEYKTDFSEINSLALTRFQLNQNQKWITLPTPFLPQEIENINIPGVSFSSYNIRFHPDANYTQDIIGQVSRKGEYFSGYSGIESYYDQQLQGKTGFLRTPKDALNQAILTKKFWQKEAINGRNLHTYLNRQIQYLVHKTLKNGIEKYSADSGSVIIIDPETAGIIAMSSQVASGSATPSAFKNPAIADTFEPGSIFKPLIIAIGLDSNKISTNYKCDKCNQPLTIGQYTISNWDNAVYPDSNLYEIIKNSDNIAMSHIIRQISTDTFLKYYSLLNLDRKTGVDLQGEGRSPQKKYWPEIDLATASFGQGIALTQIQMVSAFNALASNGKYVPPKVVDYIDDNGKIISNRNHKANQVFKKDTTEELKKILQYGVENGVVSQFKPDNLIVCAKSGTAQIAVKGEYTDSATIASYIGFAPCNNPKFTMIVTINNPKTSPWGSSTAAPIWFELAGKLQYLL